jgi:hypothetical protein
LCSFGNWTGAAASGAALPWRVKSDLVLPVLELLPDRSYSSVPFRPGLHDKARRLLIAAARAAEDLDENEVVTSASWNPPCPAGLVTGKTS